ncbi:hybrid sensor histidine kinase/response regulator [Mucilaginibacter sp. X4EP1]|uniref:ATP-binding response regulator n=1 Tax=Mucilaginibacter sp. X4EP1 TaxID=2723092 RepID=UPI002168A806|nr:ATP-binding protein [Mucilaginibacter sp. X4EP1]MCS3816384.1 signal transduction histidine kinase [Mucilaginibacter sp. X4EP1]
MGKITDRYHQLIRPDNKHLNPLFDIKEVPKRTYQIGIAIMLTGIMLSCYDAGIKMYVSSFLVACFCFAILMFMYLKYNGDIKDLTISIISLVCALLVFSACLEGLQSDQYLYFFPLLIAVPLLVDLKKTHYRKSVVFLTIIIASFIICICIGRYVKPLEDFTAAQVGKLALMNRIIAICSTIVFATLYTLFEKKYIDELVEQSNKVINTKTQFLATMGHELRTPLNGIIGIVSLLKNETDAAKKEEYIQIIQSCSDEMLHQINDILDFNKIEAGMLDISPVSFNLHDLLNDVCNPFIASLAGKDIEIKTEIDPQTDVLIYADNIRLRQILDNLFEVAIRFTSQGFVKLKAKCHKKNDKSVAVSFSIEDTGAGFSETDREKMFESFWQVYDEDSQQLKGTGLGLSICIRLLKLMGGKLVLESERGKGSKFSFDLVFNYAEQQQPVVETAMLSDNELAGVKILLVEDNKINMLIAKKVLTGFKATVETAYNGQEALDMLLLDNSYNMILMDLEMPVMNGYTAIYEIKKILPHLPVIAITASLVDDQMLADLLASGFDDCVIKPFKPQDLLQRVQHLLAKVY